MASYVYFKFKSQKEPQRVTIDGPHTDVWNLKREIISISRLGDGTDFDLKIYKENSNEEYTDDTEIIPKDSTVLARRLPASAPGKGRAARYVSGKPPVSAKPSSSAAGSKTSKVLSMDKAMTEQERLQAMFSFTDAQWQQKQEEMAHETRVPMQGSKPFQKKANVPEGEPPHGYICYRCGKKGHWIQACPTNDDANFDNKNRIKRTTGIPRSMLKKIDQSDIDKLDENQRQNLMVNAEGEYVFAQADEKAWRKHLEQVKAAEAAQKKAQVGSRDLQDRGLECPIDKRLFVDPMKTPCCGKTYCHDCIENALIDNDLTCPGCETENVSLERLEPDEDTKQKIKEYQNEKANEKQRSRSPTASVSTPQAEKNENDSRPGTQDGSKSPSSVTGQSKKRSASEANGTPTSPSAAPAMKRQKSGDNVSTEPNRPSTAANGTDSNNGDSNVNNMPFMMPPDMSQMMQNMQQMGMGFPMPMPGMPFMPMPNMMDMNSMGMNMMPNMMPNMGFMPPHFNMNNNLNTNQGYSNQNNNNNWNNRNQNFQQNRYQNRPKPQTHSQQYQPNGMSGVPTGPKALQPSSGATGSNTPNVNQSQNQNQNQAGFYPPTGPAGNKFSNQQRHTGKEEDNAYMRQPVNPQRHIQKNRRGKPREADYREL